ncbi:hypothetical protein ASPVEDRAFT_128644 [Aspergillus versicolor CBS 583.65]|uniref:Hemerythrin-like domain-containing protein n=1 Tax=Aspergillus versicolor CBS 583.65 TaxID=1036611 RepID=A0A1L9PH99_ASPVE|nr:uncharacterized protein ASPVEDRAFT_128644 [Aspergillus versicolor CBS 583.65]OJJ00904.1 hypothetical protein ASPVEDRAFT_128644 [Aspergillus versicolor CBS 583.65]
MDAALSPADFRIYNRLASQMEQIHSEFRRTWTQLKQACPLNSQAEPNPYPATDGDDEDASDEEIIMLGLSFCEGLSMHHSIEERFFFPLLAARMPEFGPSGILAEQHELIHDGLVRLRGYLNRCERGEEGEGLDRSEVREFMDDFEQVLWEHLDGEVSVLGGENMRRFWSLDEVRRFPM